jgi:putative drug exporter of the RND superfamily
VVRAVDPFASKAISQDARYALVQVQFAGRADELTEAQRTAYEDTGVAAERAGLRVGHGGEVMNSPPEVGGTEAIGVAIALVVLLVTFGSLVAAGMTMLNALIGVGAGMAGLFALSSVVELTSVTPVLALMLGLAVGIDYSLFITSRHRQHLGEGIDPEEAAARAVGTAGSAVVFAGITVVIALAGLTVVGIPFLSAMGLAAAGTVAVAVLVAITLLPALLGFAGFTIDKFKVGRRKPKQGEGMWHRWARFVQKRPAPIAIIGFVVLIVIALPMLSLRLGSADASNDKAGTTTYDAYHLISDGFGPGANGPVLIVADTSKAGSADALPALINDLRKVPGVAAVTPPQPNEAGTAALATLFPTTGPQSEKTEQLVHHLRDNVVPQGTQGTDLAVYLGGQTAGSIDFSDTIGSRLPIFIGAVLILSFLLLMLVFRSVLVPLKAVLMNLLSIGAAYGVIVAAFQFGWGGSILGVSAGPIEAWVPMMIFAIVFGLSMDYEVFLISAIREHYDKSGDNAQAVADGLESTARVITAAALIMVFVFGSFVVSDVRALKLIGLGLAVAVAIDATIVRVILVPATMELLGKANWWLPKWLDRILPKINVEGETLDVDELEPPAREPVPTGV